jgi:2-polyprenyl-3-methyl-5-hydroxy-6-metoxy-1,4-benzoquinol methylase
MFNQRSNKKELLDGDSIPDEDLYQNLKELNIINKLLGGYKITFKALNKIIQQHQAYTIVDIGSGGGDTLKEISKWGDKQNFKFNLFGIDLKQTCIHYSIKNDPNNKISFICDDYKNVFNHLEKVDIIHACLFCHHLTNSQIVDLMKFANDKKVTLIINDLERNKIAYYSIKFLTKIFSRSYLVKNDAPLSVLRGFNKSEWLQIIKEAGVEKFSIKYRWAFRHEVIVYAN